MHNEEKSKYERIILSPFTIDELLESFRSVVKEELHLSNQKKQEKELMTTNEICEFLSISLSTLNKWKAENIIPYKKMGRRVYYDRAEVKKAMEDSNYHKYNKLFKND